MSSKIVFNLHIMSIFQEFCSLKTINNWYSKAIQTGIHYAKCVVTSRQNKKFRLKYITSTKRWSAKVWIEELVLQF